MKRTGSIRSHFGFRATRRLKIPMCVIAFAAFAIIVLPLDAQSMWSGIATVSRFGDFPDTGNYATSNSFQKNTIVEVTNLENGRRSTVIVVGRLDDPGLFLLLSRDAGDDLDIRRGEIVQVRASLAQADSLVRAAADDRPLSQDPDINPAAIVSEETRVVISSDSGRASEDEYPPPDMGETEGSSDSTEDTVADSGTEPVDSTQDEPDATSDPIDANGEADTDTTEGEEPAGPVMQPIEPVVTPETNSTILAMDEPDVPGDESAEVSSLEEVIETTDTTTEAILAEDEPTVADAGFARVLGLLPEPELDETERFVLLTRPDEPTAPEGVVIAEEVPEAPSAGLLDEPTERVDEPFLVGTPPEPVFVDRELEETPAEEPEDFLVVLPIESPGTLTDSGSADSLEGSLSDVALDEPAPIGTEDDEEAEFYVDAFTEPSQPDATDDETELASGVMPEPLLGAPSVASLADASPRESLMVAALDDELDPDEPDFDLDGASGDDVARIDQVITLMPEFVTESVGAPADADADEPATPALLEDVEIVLEPAEPRPPQPTVQPYELAASDPTLDTATAFEPSLPVVGRPDRPNLGVAAVEQADTTEGSVEAAAEPIRVAVATNLASDAFYLQLAVFSKATNAQTLSDSLSERYPITVFKPEAGSGDLYKVLVGPLSEDESGALLYTFRSRGYTDAFVRREP